MESQIVIRPAERRDATDIARLIHSLALYEMAPEQCFATTESVEREIFGERPSAEVIIAEVEGRPVALALFFQTFSTWVCRPGMFLEDLFVEPEHRKRGIGGMLLQRCAEICRERQYGRFEWACLEWN
jgi:GNAT superfamily N-acetyltransferase